VKNLIHLPVRVEFIFPILQSLKERKTRQFFTGWSIGRRKLEGLRKSGTWRYGEMNRDWLPADNNVTLRN
jgi:hypothetical protein